MHLLYGAKWSLDLTLRAGRHSSAILALRQMSTHINVQVTHDLLKHVAPGDRTIIEVDHFRNPLKQETLDLFRRHGVKQETQAGFNILTVDTTVFLISDAAAVIDDAEKHQCGRALARPQPQGFLDFLEIRRTQVELPAIVAVFGLKTDRCRLPAQRLVVIAPLPQITIDGGSLEHRFLCLNETVGGFDAELFDQADRFSGGQMPSFLIRCPNLEGGDEFAVILHLVLRQYPRCTTI